MKSFVGIYETPAGTILYKAHMDIENFTMDRVFYLDLIDTSAPNLELNVSQLIKALNIRIYSAGVTHLWRLFFLC